ncbi:MAG: ABC-F type ribosomal protection protein [Erysipelotrichaceae bacterium]|nr:ABC-F type ribosomal protection protein [Erysipelotrichaceae bacterium]
MLLQVNNGTKDFRGEVLFEDINFEIKEGRKIAVIGRNGCGKTTLLKVISGLLMLDKGTVTRSSGISIGYLSQTAFEDESLTVEQEFNKTYSHVLEARKRMEELARKLEQEYDEDIFEQYSHYQQIFESGNGYNYNQEQVTLFSKFGFDIEDLQRPLNTFSGGQKTKIAFVRLLLQKPDLLLLDEPTNHLDVTTIEWLEGYLQKYPSAIVIVSHDRMFIDHVASEIYEFEFGKLNHFVGNYSSYMEEKKKSFAIQQSAYRRQQREIERLSAQIEKFRYKKEKAAFAQSKIKYLERMERIEKPREDKKNFKLRFEPKLRGGASVLTVDNLTIGYDTPLCTVDFQVRNGQRLGIIGPNGLGKSTLLKTLIGQVEPLGGEYMYGHQIEIGYFDQQLAEFTTDNTVLEELWNEFPEYDHTAIRKILGQFMFTADDVYKACNILSGGEKVRLSLAKLMLSGSNLLILDEPTNHLDIPGKEALEDALLEYTGTVIFVSHDRYFVRKLATAILRIEAENTRYYPLNYDEYQDKLNGRYVEVTSEKEVEAEPVSQAKLQRQNAKKTVLLEKKIARCEEELEKLRELRWDPEYYQDSRKMARLEDQIDEKHNEIDRLMKEWEECAG